MPKKNVSRRLLATGVTWAAALALAATGAVPAQAAPERPSPGPDARVAAALRSMSLQEKVGQLFFQNVYGSDATTPDARNIPLYGVASPAGVVQKYHLGGVIYFAWTDSVKNPPQITGLSNGLQKAAIGSGAHVPLMIATDQEQGVVTRIGPPATQFPGSMALGAGRSTTDARAAAAITGQELKAMGINTDFAPDADVNVNALNPVIGTRSFSSDPALVSSMVAAQVNGYQKDAGIIATPKHFPGHGDTATDSHTGIPIITHSKAQWEQIDAPPFKAAIRAGADMIMSGHLVVPALDPSGDPATLSKPILTGILRGELGYKGVIITDSLAMQGVRDKYGDAEVAVRAVLAGVDSLLMTPTMDASYDAVVAAVTSGRISEKRLNESVSRILILKLRKGILSHPYTDATRLDSVVGTPAHLATATAITDRTTTLVKNDKATLPMAVGNKKILVTGYGAATTTTLADALMRRGATVTRTTSGAAPTGAAIADAVAKTAGQDAVIVTTMKAWDTAATDKLGGQQKLVAALLATGKPVVVVAVRDPYDIAYLPGVSTYLATYSYSPVAIESAVRVIVGEVAPTGKLPVDIPVAGDPATALFPFGFGLTW
ncbi:MAG: glycoside hydrolase family 3 C-terminal domain-containing protein [Dermatophilaceae bacterium]|nr:glycoside hydrolase family 3 C-terminal domain-containing protein [Dermatophilaceae bacterium]